jgi:hypothetical protein
MVRAIMTEMSTQPETHARVSLQQIVEVLKTLSPDKLESAYDYLLFLRSQYPAMSNSYGSISHEELIAAAALTFR